MDEFINKNEYKYDIFISYSSTDRPFVQQVVYTLKNNGYRVWRDEDILFKYSGERYRPHVESGIDESAVVLYIHSNSSVRKTFVQNKELPYALKKKKKILLYPHGIKSRPKNPEMWSIQRVAIADNPETGEKDEMFSILSAVQRCFGDLTPSGRYVKLETCSEIWSPEHISAQLTNVKYILPIPESRREELRSLGFYSEASEDTRMLERLRCFFKKYYNDKDADTFIEETACEVADYVLERLRSHATMFNGPMVGVSEITAQRSPDGIETHSLTMKMYRSDYFTFKVMSKIYGNLIASLGDKENPFDIHTVEDIPHYAPFLCSLGMGGFLLQKEEQKESALWIKRSSGCEAANLYHFSYDETVAIKDLEEDGKTVNLYGTLYRGIKEELGLSGDELMHEGGIFEIGVILTSSRIELELLSFRVLHPSAHSRFPELLEAADDSKLEVGEQFFLQLGDYRRELAGRFPTPEALALIQRLEVRYKDEMLLKQKRNTLLVQISPLAEVGKDVKTDDFVIMGDRCRIGQECKIHHFVHIDDDVVIGNRVKIQNNVMIPHGVTLEDGVFVGPSVVFTNDKNPRSITPDGQLKSGDDWTMTPTVIKEGASLGGGAVIVCGVTIGRWAMVGAGAVVTKDVPDYALVVGCPAKVVGRVNEKGEIVAREEL